jgi:hypothetical protein
MSTAPIDPWAFGWTSVAAITTVVAVVVALFVAARDTRILVLTKQQEREDRRREQATRVSAWATSETEFPDTPRQNIVGNPWFGRIHVLNGSQVAINDVTVTIGHRNLQGAWYSLMSEHEWPMLPPGAEVFADFREGHVRNFSQPPHNVLLCKLSFRDGNNVRWARDERGYLSELETDAGGS